MFMRAAKLGLDVFKPFAMGLWRLFACIACVFLVLQTASYAAPLTTEDEKAVHDVVQKQLVAFAKDDAARAFSFAAPNIRQSVGSPANFMAMVRENYPVVYRPASVAFLKAEGADDQVTQAVQMRDANGDAWLAIYTLERQKKTKAWRITGCALVENKGRVA